MISEPILRGRTHRIVFIQTGTGNAQTFRQLAAKLRAKGPVADQMLDRPTSEDKPPKDGPSVWKKLVARMERACIYGLDQVCRNQSVCKRFRGEDKGLGEFKSKPIRVMFFECEREQGLIVLTHCFSKKRDDTPPEEMNRARRLQTAYYEWLDSQNDTKQP